MTTIRFATTADADSIVALMKTAYDPKVLDVTVYGCHGIAQYLIAQLALPPSIAETHYLVADNEGVLQGVIELRYVGTAIFVNYLCTAPDRRGAGVAQAMLREGIPMVRRPHHASVSLDVFQDNIQARQWYRRLGFAPIAQTAWWRLPLVRRESVPGRVAAYAQATACHHAYGFSSFTMTTSAGDYTIGKLGTRWFRTSSAALLHDDEARACLVALDPRRQLLALLPLEQPHACPDAEMVCLSERMTIQTEALLVHLAAR